MLFFSSISFFLLLAFIIYSFKRKPNHTFLTLAAILFIILGTIRHQIANLKYGSNHLTNKVHVDQANKLVFSVKEIFKESKKSRKYKVRIHYYNNENTYGYALLSIPKNNTNSKLNLGNTFITYSKLKLLTETRNPYAFEYTNSLKNMGITHKLWVTNQQLYQIKTLSNPWNIFFNTIRSNIEERLQKQALNPQVLQITEALVLGNKSSLKK